MRTAAIGVLTLPTISRMRGIGKDCAKNKDNQWQELRHGGGLAGTWCQAQMILMLFALKPTVKTVRS
jgi:hypothetical protein